MESADNNNNTQSRHTFLCKQPITCPWINSQPYPSTVNKNKSCEATSSKSTVSITNIILYLAPSLKLGAIKKLLKRN